MNLRSALPTAGLVLLAAVLGGCTEQQILGTMDAMKNGGAAPLSNGEVVSGLKEALRVGTERSVSLASAVNGFNGNALIRVPFPEDAIKVRNTLMDLGLKKPVEDFELTLNRAAEAAAKEAVPVFVEAITSMSIADGFAILRGGENAATNYLKEKTTAALLAKFRPVVEKATRQVALAQYWKPVADAYNTATLLTGGKAVEPDLDAYVTRKAADGLFVLLANEEKKIRQDPLARTTDLLRRVFGAQ
ncbi:MAG: DUF4197 domain-containing protein [Flavobacteriales bacterium]